MKQQFSTTTTLAASIAAYHYNNSTVLRNITIDQTGQETQPNRQIMLDCLKGKHSNLRINDHYIKEAEGIVTYLQQTVIMQSLKGNPDQFLSQITALLVNQEVSESDMGILAWAPHVADQYQKKDHVRELSARHERSSRYVGKIKDKIEIGFTLIEKRYISNMDCYAVYGVDDHGNCIFYWAKTLDKVCEVGKITGRVKAHQEDKHRNNARVTTLNYVKVL